MPALRVVARLGFLNRRALCDTADTASDRVRLITSKLDLTFFLLS